MSSVVFRAEDDFGNMILMNENGVHLRLLNKSRGKFRQILSREGNQLTKFVPKENVMRIDNSIGFCKKALEELVNTQFTHIQIIVDGTGTWTMPVQDILDKGHDKHFMQQGFEKQIFLVLPNMPS